MTVKDYLQKHSDVLKIRKVAHDSNVSYPRLKRCITDTNKITVLTTSEEQAIKNALLSYGITIFHASKD